MSGLDRVSSGYRFVDVVYHPSVHPHVSLGREIPDLIPIVADPANVCLMNEHGGFLFVQSGENVYDTHTAFLPEGRGASLVARALEARSFMFNHGAELLRTFVADENKAAHRLAVAAGFKNAERMTIFGHDGWLMTMDRSVVCQ